MERIRRAVKTAFPATIPVMTGYIFLGMAFGVLLESKGYGFWWALLISTVVYAGSMQFVAVGLLAGGFDPLSTALLTLMVNARHIFYGIAMLGKFRGMGKEKPYMIFSLTDETFSLLVAAEPPEDVKPNLYYLCISVMNHLYWITGSVIGSLAGAAVQFNTQGIEFVMTALFVVIFLEQWRTRKGRAPAMVGVSAALVCLLVFGREWFIIPTMVALVVILLAVRKPLERGVEP